MADGRLGQPEARRRAADHSLFVKGFEHPQQIQIELVHMNTLQIRFRSYSLGGRYSMSYLFAKPAERSPAAAYAVGEVWTCATTSSTGGSAPTISPTIGTRVSSSRPSASRVPRWIGCAT